MSKGTLRVTIRIGDKLKSAVDLAVRRRNENGVSKEHWDLTKYILRAITEKLRHDHRSNKGRKKA